VLALRGLPTTGAAQTVSTPQHYVALGDVPHVDRVQQLTAMLAD
jgi:hypothetical protein